jgi:mRNA-degrading endonuclease toxin of MazEF toxin-antitoxin module
MDTYYPQGAIVVLDHDPYGDKSSRPVLVISDDKHPDRYDETVEDPAYTAALLTTGFYTDNAWARKITYTDLTEGKTLSRRNSHIMVWAVRPIYESEIGKRVAQVTANFLRSLGADYGTFFDPDESRL